LAALNEERVEAYQKEMWTDKGWVKVREFTSSKDSEQVKEEKKRKTKEAYHAVTKWKNKQNVKKDELQTVLLVLYKTENTKPKSVKKDELEKKLKYEDEYNPCVMERFIKENKETC